jgi:hypothetical protein
MVAYLLHMIFVIQESLLCIRKAKKRFLLNDKPLNSHYPSPPAASTPALF